MSTDKVEVRIDCDEAYPVYDAELATPVDKENAKRLLVFLVEITREEWEDYRKVTEACDAWQEKLGQINEEGMETLRAKQREAARENRE